MVSHQLLTLAGEVFGPVEGHVLQEVSQTTLTRLLLDGTHALGDIEVRESCLLGVMTDIIGQAVLEFSCPDVRILG